MSEPLGDNGRITFTVKELLAKVDAKLDVIVGRLDEKADAHDLDSLEKRVSVLEGSAATEAQLRTDRQKHAQERKRDRRWFVGLAIPSMLGLLALVGNAIVDFLTGG